MTAHSTSEARFDKLITFLIASVAILASITVFLQNYASGVSEETNRIAQEYAIQSTSAELRGIIEYSYDWQGAFQTSNEVDMQRIAAQINSDASAENRYTQLGERLVPLSPLLSEPYFDESQNWPRTGKYEAELYVVEAMRLEELYQAEAEVGRAWSSIADVFVIQLTLLTVALSLFGLSLTLHGFVRGTFVLLGSGLVLFCMAWMAFALVSSKPVVSETAIHSFARGYGEYYQGNYEEAIRLYNEALTIKPDYANAFYERAVNHLLLDEFDAAVSDFLAARDLGLEGEYTYWNLGWTYYLMGNYNAAIQANNAILDGDPSVVGMRSNQALNYLALGDFARAQAEYDALLGEVEKQVRDARANNTEPSASLWYYMDAAALDLQNLSDQLSGNLRYWTEAPESSLVPGDHTQIIAFAQDEFVRLKEATLALEYSGRLPQAQDAMQVSPFSYGYVTIGDDGFVSDFEVVPDAVFPAFTPAISIQFTYNGSLPQEQLLWKFYLDGYEYAAFREVWGTDLSQSDTWYKTVGFNYTNIFVLVSGEYVVELYADYRLVQSGAFTVLSE